MADPKPEEISHHPMDQLQGLEYCIDSNPSCVEAIALGFQHYVLALGTYVMIPSFLVPLMGGTDGDKVRVVQTLLFVEGINTPLQMLFGTRLPTVIGGSWAFMVSIISIIHDSSLERIPGPHVRFVSTIRAIQGALIVASSVQIIMLGDVWRLAFQCSSYLLPSLRIKIPYVLEWGAPTFDAGHAFGMIVAVLVSMIEVKPKAFLEISDLPNVSILSTEFFLLKSTGAYFRRRANRSHTPPPAHVLSHGIG
ncbi:unnamed protein product [Fraxinus pennsylvanica]|uniref:Uncharacterized protein n=1 Tax=Fraxinus pennsylvanica TaxID=56036 RepID=A0AAD2A5Q2_9LAMI|nr:unnamed protein product [Fraxinus pennsylvanica]